MDIESDRLSMKDLISKVNRRYYQRSTNAEACRGTVYTSIDLGQPLLSKEIAIDSIWYFFGAIEILYRMLPPIPYFKKLDTTKNSIPSNPQSDHRTPTYPDAQPWLQPQVRAGSPGYRHKHAPRPSICEAPWPYPRGQCRR